MNINWRVRLNNPVFWRSLAVAVAAPIVGHFGANLAQITTWAALSQLITEVIGNPAVLLAVAASVWNLLIDPTTKGVSDSARVMAYTEPR